MKIRNAYIFFFLSGFYLFLTTGRILGKPASLPASSTSSTTSSIIEDSIPRLGRVAHSPDQLIRNALIRLKKRDTLGIILMGPNPDQLISIYTRTPDGKKASEAQINFIKEFYYLDNGKLFERALSNYSGKQLELISWKSKTPPLKVDGGGQILRDIEIWVKDMSTNSDELIPFIQSIYVDSDGCKIWGFRDHKAGDKEAKR